MKKDKQILKNVQNLVGDHSRWYLLAMLDGPLLTRLRWAVIIIFHTGYKDLIGGGADGTKRELTE